MPVTPFHMGPGLLIKSVLQGWFSLIIFGWAQVLMDIQPLVAMTTGMGSLHGFSHTYIGASLIAIIAAWSGKWIYRWCMRFIERDFTYYQKKLLDVPARLTAGICFISAFLGTFSHVLLDSIMHADLEPFYPVSPDNRLLLIISIGALYKFCVYTGITGGVVFLCVRLALLKYRKAGKST